MAGHRLPYSRLYTHATSVILAPFRSLHPRKPAFHYAPNISYRNLRLWLAPLALVPFSLLPPVFPFLYVQESFPPYLRPAYPS